MQNTTKLTTPTHILTDTTSGADAFLSEDEAARVLNISVRTLQRWRQDGRSGLPFRRFGGLVRYSMRDIEAWATAQSRMSTSERASA